MRWLDRLADAPLERVDVLWLRDAVEPEPRLLAWLRAGGRLLATQAAVRLVSPLGLESHPPTDIPLPDPFPADFGLAGFGAHPLLAGLRDGALLAGRPIAERPMTGYDGSVAGGGRRRCGAAGAGAGSRPRAGVGIRDR